MRGLCNLNKEHVFWLQSCKTCNPVGPCGICCWMNHGQQKKGVCAGWELECNWTRTSVTRYSDIILVFERRYLSICFGSLSEESTKQTSFFLQGGIKKCLRKQTTSFVVMWCPWVCPADLSTLFMKTHLVLWQAVQAGRELPMQQLCTLNRESHTPC